tara:strand:+ start:952 stop:1122 length:171 start_codon:yes stop_codon:yes gene_type:complete
MDLPQHIARNRNDDVTVGEKQENLFYDFWDLYRSHGRFESILFTISVLLPAPGVRD